MGIQGVGFGNNLWYGNHNQGPSEHVVAQGETLDSIAKDHGITSQALYDANPQIHPPVLFQAGMRLTIPEPDPKATTSDAGSATATGKVPVSEVKTGTDANGTSSTTEGSVKVGSDGSTEVGGSQKNSTTQTDANGNKTTDTRSGSASVGVNPDKGTVSVSAGTGFSKEIKNSKGVGVSFGIDAKATVVTGQKTDKGVTTYSVSTDASISLKAGASSKQAGLEVGHTDGIKASYEVSMPEAAAKTTNLATVNPFDPDSMPTGTVIKIDGSKYTTNEFKATFKNLAVATKITDEKGTSLLVEKTGDNTVKVTAGPTAAIQAYNGVGVDFGVASAMLGRDDKLSSATLKTAEFDLSTPEGKAAYNDFVANGNLPSDNGTGVSGVKTIEKLDYSSQTKLDAKLGPLEIGIDGAKNTGNSVVTTEPDGSITRTVQLQYSGNVPMTISQKFDASGNELMDQRTYSYTIKADDNTAQMLNVAQTGDIGSAKNGSIKPGQTVTITYTEAEMKELMTDAQKALDASGGMNSSLRILTQDYDGKAVSPFDFALGLGRNLGGSDYGSAERLFTIASDADGDQRNGYVKLPGTVTTQG